MNTAEEIKQRLDIVSSISEYVDLEKSGRYFKGVCPFHTEKTPSFFVFPDKQSWRCFGCNEGGDLISFVMKKEGLDFGQAMKLLAPRAGVILPEKRQQTAQEKQAPAFHRINEIAAEYYHQLLISSPAAELARKYIEGRHLNNDTVSKFRLGFSLDSWDALKSHLAEKGYKDKDIVTAGLAIEKEDHIYDRFRGRLMFPITDPKGRAIGFGARALDDSTPKYLNSSESPVFAKNAVLYGIDKARSAISEHGKVIIVEGYMDALTAHQNGFQNVVASMGTALTENQIAIIKGMARHIILSLDADAAGTAATLRGIEICRNALAQKVTGSRGWMGAQKQLETEISIISMPEGKDPDEVIRQDPKEWQRLVDNAVPLMDHLFESIAREYDLSRPEEISQFINRLIPLISEIADSGAREIYLTKLSRLSGLTDDFLKKKIADLYKTRPKKKLSANMETARPIQTGDPLEEQCLVLMLKHRDLKEMATRFSPDHFERSENREIFLAICQSDPDDDISNILDPALQEHLQALFNRKQPPSDKKTRERELTECLDRLEVRNRKAALAAEINIEENSARLKELWHQRSVTSHR